MSKKKKKVIKLTSTQKLTAALHSTGEEARSAAERFRAFITEKDPCGVLYRKFDAFIAYRWSAAPLAVLLLALMLFTYSLTRYHYLFGNFPYYATRMSQFYLIDYNVGFVSRALIGQIISLFTDKVSMALIVRLTGAVIWLSLILQAILAAAAFKKAWLNRSPLLCALFVLFAVSHHTVIPNVINFGVLDTYNLLLAILYIYISDTKAAYVLTPVICFTGIILHYQFVLAYLALILSIELYYIIKNDKGRKLRTAIFCFTVLGSAALTVYLVFFSKYHTKMNAEELYDYMYAKFTDVRGWGLFEEYFTYYIYGDYQGINYSNPAAFVRFLVRYAIERINPVSHVFYALSTFPVFGILGAVWIRLFRATEKKKRLPYVVFFLQPLTLAAAMVVSTDTSRWAGAAWFSCFMQLIPVLKNDPVLLKETAAKLVNSRWKRVAVCAILLGSYACTVYIYASY